jgi:hypothetical protein
VTLRHRSGIEEVLGRVWKPRSCFDPAPNGVMDRTGQRTVWGSGRLTTSAPPETGRSSPRRGRNKRTSLGPEFVGENSPHLWNVWTTGVPRRYWCVDSGAVARPSAVLKPARRRPDSGGAVTSVADALAEHASLDCDSNSSGLSQRRAPDLWRADESWAERS